MAIIEVNHRPKRSRKKKPRNIEFPLGRIVEPGKMKVDWRLAQLGDGDSPAPDLMAAIKARLKK